MGDLGRHGEARAEIALGIDEARRNGVGFMLPMMDSWLAEAARQELARMSVRYRLSSGPWTILVT